MKTVLQALPRALMEAAAGKPPRDNLSIPAREPVFSLSPVGNDPPALRVAATKAAHHQASAAKNQPDAGDPAAMQALLALLLPRPEQAVAAATRSGDGEPLRQMLAAQTGGGVAPLTARLAQRMSGAQRTSSAPVAAESATPDELPPKLQALLSALMPPGANATPQQQAQLSQLAARDLQAIAPGAPPVVHVASIAHVPSMVRPAARGAALQKATAAPTAALLSTQVDLNHAQSHPLAQHGALPAGETLPVDAHAEEWGEKLTSLLKDRLQFQIDTRQQTSTIRLDPPSLGKLEIAIQLDAGKLVVHIGASQSDVYRALQQFSDNLRQHLTEQNFVEVNVQVSPDGQSRQQQQSGDQQEQVLSALTLNDAPLRQRNDSVLIKV